MLKFVSFVFLIPLPLIQNFQNVRKKKALDLLNFLVFQVYLNNNKFKLYVIINYLVIAISLGYVVLSLIVALLYIAIDKYFIHILEYLHFESYNDDVELISATANSSRKIAYYRRKIVFEIS